MPKPRLPKEKVKALGRDVVNPARFDGRNGPLVTTPLGDPPEWLSESERKAWETFREELFWLNSSHRALLEIACNVRARLMVPSAEGVGIQALNLLRQCLGQMGATPADASKVNLPDAEGEKDPADKYF